MFAKKRSNTPQVRVLCSIFFHCLLPRRDQLCLIVHGRTSGTFWQDHCRYNDITEIGLRPEWVLEMESWIMDEVSGGEGDEWEARCADLDFLRLS